MSLEFRIEDFEHLTLVSAGPESSVFCVNPNAPDRVREYLERLVGAHNKNYSPRNLRLGFDYFSDS